MFFEFWHLICREPSHFWQHVYMSEKAWIGKDQLVNDDYESCSFPPIPAVTEQQLGCMIVYVQEQ